MLEAIHEGHLGITKCQGRAAYSIWWPLITKHIESMVNRCRICSKLRPERKEPLIALSYPSMPWTRLGTDLFELDKKTYIVVVDYTSRWFEIKQLHTVTSSAVIRVLCELFATHGIPDTVVSDNGPQYACQEFNEFAKDWGFQHVTSSPVYPQANGEVERAVETAKNVLRKNANPYLGLLAYRTAPLRNGLTPAELLMSRKLKTRLPAIPEVFKPTEVDRKEVARKEQAYREKYTRNYNEHHRVVPLPSLSAGDRVYIRDQQKYGEIQGRHNNPRSYQLVTETGATIRRNRRSLIHTGENSATLEEETGTTTTCSQEATPPAIPPIAPSPTTDEAPVRRSNRHIKPNKQPDMHYY